MGLRKKSHRSPRLSVQIMRDFPVVLDEGAKFILSNIANLERIRSGVIPGRLQLIDEACLLKRSE